MSGKQTQMTKEDSSRIQSGQAKGGGDMSKDGFASRAQSAGDRNANAGGGGAKGGQGGGQSGQGGQGGKK